MSDKQRAATAPAPKRRFRFGKGALVVLLSLVALDWLVRLRYFPGHDARAFAALPEGALFGEFTDFAGAWGKTLKAPFVSQALRLASVDPETLADDPGTLWLIRLTTGKTVAASLEVPRDGLARDETVLSAASYGGWRTPLLRFMLETRWIPGLGRLEASPGGARYLRLGSKSNPSDFVVAFALRRDILVATLSTDPDDVLVLEKRLEEKAPPSGRLARIAPWSSPEPACPYRFWLAEDPLSHKPLDGEFSIRIGPLWHSAPAAWIAADCPAGALQEIFGRSRLSGRVPKADALAANAASAICLAPPGLARRELDVSLFNGKRPRSPAEDEEGEDDAALYLSRAPYGSSFLGFPAPAATLLCPGLFIDARRIEDRLSPVAASPGFPSFRGVRTEGNHSYALVDWLGKFGHHKPFRLPSSECGVVELPANGRGLLFCSSMKSLSMQRTGRAGGAAPWRAWLDPRLEARDGEAVLFLWLDVDALLDDARQLMTVADLFRRFSPGRFKTGHLDLMAFAGRVLATFGPTGRLALLASIPGEDRLEVEIGLRQ